MKRRRDPPLLSLFGTDPIDKKRSDLMSRVRGKDTKPEIALRQAISAAGARYRIHPRALPGRPDIAHKGARIAVFVDGCFWHGCPKHFRLPKTRTDFWKEKIRRNKATRRRVLREYTGEWHVFEFYECQIAEELPRIAQRISHAIEDGRDA